MILLDTNIISESLRREPESRVISWLDRQDVETLWLSAITVAELRAGVEQLPTGRRQAGLRQMLEARLFGLFDSRIIPFDNSCTFAYADLLAIAKRAGRGISTADALIAATAKARGMIVATRDTAPFLAAGLEVIDPWNMP